MFQRYYAITIKCIKQGVYASKEEIYEVFKEMVLKVNGQICAHSFELDSIDRWHLHGIFLAESNLYRRRLKKPYWHIFVEEIMTEEDLHKWHNYLTKDEREMIRRIQSEYSFQD